MQERGPAVVSFNQDGNLPPVVFFHTWSSEREHLRALAALLGPDQPLYGIEPPPSVEGAMPERIDEWLAHHRPRFDSLPVDPPYHLAGFSFGGVVALEVARQLHAEGMAVAWLGLVDTMRPRLNPKGLGPYVRYHVRELRELANNGYRRRYLRRLRRGGTHRTKIRIKVMSYRLLARLHLVEARPKTLGEAKGMSPLKRSVLRGYLSYEATPYREPVALFTGAGSRDTALGDINLRWSNFLTGGLEVTEVEGKHLELFSPENVHSVGEAIRNSLARCQGMSSTRPNA